MASRTQHSNLARDLTERQQEVLGLIAAGRTNPEIAEALGVSLAGAKWHVSELISRLGVETREEAAEVWREAHSLPRRFQVWVRGFLGVGLIKVAAGGIASAATVGLGVGTISVVRDSRHDESATSEMRSLDALHAGYAENQARLQALIASSYEPESPQRR